MQGGEGAGSTASERRGRTHGQSATALPQEGEGQAELRVVSYSQVLTFLREGRNPALGQDSQILTAFPFHSWDVFPPPHGCVLIPPG